MSSEHRPPARTPPPQDEPWAELRALTAARIALPRAGASLATAPQLDLRLAHARARDAVHAQLDEARLVAELAPLGLGVLAVASAAADRQHYLMRPDLGRRLAGNAEARLAAHAGSGHDVAFVIADGLSAPIGRWYCIPASSSMCLWLKFLLIHNMIRYQLHF
jgi:ethanolamine ammonia-lyase small subunit